MNPKLAIAHAVQRKSKGGMIKCAHGGPIQCMEGCYAEGGEVNEPISIVSAIMKKRAGNEEMPLMEDDNSFLSANDEDSEAQELSYPDPDNMEEPEKKNHLLKSIMSKRMSR